MAAASNRTWISNSLKITMRIISSTVHICSHITTDICAVPIGVRSSKRYFIEPLQKQKVLKHLNTLHTQFRSITFKDIYGTRYFIALFTAVCHRLPSCLRRIQSEVQFMLITNLTHTFLMCLFHFSTSFEQPSAHHQENQFINTSSVIYHCVGTIWCIDTIGSPDDEHWVARNM